MHLDSIIRRLTFLFVLTLSLTSASSLQAQLGTWEFIHNGANCKNHGQTGSCMQSRHEASYVQVGDKFYLLGGREHNSNVNIYDPIKDIWTVGADAPMDIHHFQAVEYNGLILIAGAMTGNFPNETPVPNIIIYDPKVNKWITGPPISRPRGSAGVVIRNDKLYLVSGILNGHKSGWVPWLDEYDLKTNTWKTLRDAPHSRDHFHAAIIGTKIVAAAGRRSGQSGTFNATEGAVDIYDISTNKWTTNSKDIPTHRAAAAVGVIGNEIIYIGGEKNSGAANKETEAFNISTGKWRTLRPLNVGRHGTQAIVNNENIWVASGSPNRGGGQTTTQERFYLNKRATPSGKSLNRSSLASDSELSVLSDVKSLVISNTGGNQAIYVSAISLSGDNTFSYTLKDRKLPFILKSGDSFTVDIRHTSGINDSGTLQITHSGANNKYKVNLNSKIEIIPSSTSFTPDPNKSYYLDVPALNKRLAATGSSENAYTTSTITTGENVEWKFIDKGNGYWHIQRAAGGNKPRLRTDNTEDADMQETSSSGSYTYFTFNTGASSNTHYLTLPDGPSNHKRLQMTPDGELKFVSILYKGTWVSWRITEVIEINKVVHIRKRNALDFALDGKTGATNGQNVHLWSQNPNSVNQQWIQIDRGNGFYSFQKMDTNLCLAADSGGSNSHNVYIATCKATNQNQHWQKKNMDNGFVQLRKRNAQSYTINGGGNNTKGANIGLYDSNNSHHNLQWLIEEIPGLNQRGAEDISLQNENQSSDKAIIYPNPTNGLVYVDLESFIDKAVDLYVVDYSGKLHLSRKLNDDHEAIEEIDLSNSSNGIYFIYIKANGKSTKVEKIILNRNY